MTLDNDCQENKNQSIVSTEIKMIPESQEHVTWMDFLSPCMPQQSRSNGSWGSDNKVRCYSPLKQQNDDK